MKKKKHRKMNCKSMNNNCWSLTLVALLSAIQVAIGCRGGRILSELGKWWGVSFKARYVSIELPAVNDVKFRLTMIDTWDVRFCIGCDVENGEKIIRVDVFMNEFTVKYKNWMLELFSSSSSYSAEARLENFKNVSWLELSDFFSPLQVFSHRRVKWLSKTSSTLKRFFFRR